LDRSPLHRGFMEDLIVLNKFLNAIESQDIKTIVDCLHYNMKLVNPIGTMDKLKYLNFKKSLYFAFPDFKYNPKIICKENGFYLVKINMTGTHTGVFINSMRDKTQYINPTGKRIVLPEQEMRYSIKGDKIYRIVAENVAGGGILSILRQIGVKLPPQFLISMMVLTVSILRTIKKFCGIAVP
jgi:hypothetical protein